MALIETQAFKRLHTDSDNSSSFASRACLPQLSAAAPRIAADVLIKHFMQPADAAWCLTPNATGRSLRRLQQANHHYVLTAQSEVT